MTCSGLQTNSRCLTKIFPIQLTWSISCLQTLQQLLLFRFSFFFIIFSCKKVKWAGYCTAELSYSHASIKVFVWCLTNIHYSISSSLTLLFYISLLVKLSVPGCCAALNKKKVGNRVKVNQYRPEGKRESIDVNKNRSLSVLSSSPSSLSMNCSKTMLMYVICIASAAGSISNKSLGNMFMTEIAPDGVTRNF